MKVLVLAAELVVTTVIRQHLNPSSVQTEVRNYYSQGSTDVHHGYVPKSGSSGADEEIEMS